MKRAKAVAVCGILTISLAAAGLTGCGEKIDGTEAAITVDGETVNMGTANFLLRYQQAETYAIMSQMMAYYSSNSGVWDTVYTDDQTYGEQFKQTEEDQIVEMVLLRQHAEEYEVSLTEEEQTTIDETAQTVYDANTDVFEKMGTTKDDVAEALELLTYQQKMQDPMVEDTDREVSDDEAAQSTVTYTRISVPEDTESESDTESGSESEDTLTAEETLAEAQSVLDQIQASDDPASADMDAIAEAVDEDFYTGTYSYGDDDDTMDEAFMEAARSLTDGQVYDSVIETDTYYYIVRMDAVFDEEATETEKESIISQRESDNYDEKIAAWKEDIEIETSSAWDSLEVKDSDLYVEKTADETESSSEESTSADTTTESTSADETTASSSEE